MMRGYFWILPVSALALVAWPSFEAITQGAATWHAWDMGVVVGIGLMLLYREIGRRRAARRAMTVD